jgi:hypothetical protein
MWRVIRIGLFGFLVVASALAAMFSGPVAILVWIATVAAFVGISKPRASWLAIILFVAAELLHTPYGYH